MSFLYQQLYKTNESSRELNHRADQRMGVDIEEKKGIRAEMDGKIERASREQRMLERELHRIRRSVYRRPVETDTMESRHNVSPVRHSKPLNVSAVTSLTPIRLSIDDNANTPEQRIILESTPRQQESGRSSKKQQSFSQSPKINTPDHPMHIDVGASPAFHHAFQQYMVAQPPRLPPLNEHEAQATTDRTRVSFMAESNTIDAIPNIMKASNDLQTLATSSQDSPRFPNVIDPFAIQSSRLEVTNQHSSGIKHNLRKPLDVVQLSSVDIENVRVNVSKRLSKIQVHAHLPASKKITRRTQSIRLSREQNISRSHLSVIGEKAIGDTKEGNRRRAKRNDEYRIEPERELLGLKHFVDRRNPELKFVMDILANKEKPGMDPYKYNPDGSLKTALNLPSFQKRYEEAKKARYIRHKDLKYREKELSIREIFNP